MTDGQDGRTKLRLYGLPLGSTKILSYEKMISAWLYQHYISKRHMELL